MLSLMLHSHPRIAIAPETRYFFRLYDRRYRVGDLSERRNRRRLARVITRDKRFPDLGLDAAAVTRRIVAEAPTAGAAMGTVLRMYAERFGKPRWGDKRPVYQQYIPFLLRLFPDAQFVSIVRDGRDVVASLNGMRWWHKSVAGSIAEWTSAVRNSRRWARRLGPDRYHTLQYEQLVADPAGELKRLCDFLGEDFDPAMTQPKEVAAVVVPDRKKEHQRTKTDVSDDAVGRFREGLTPAQLGLCEAVMGRMLRRYGYQLTGAPRPGPLRLAAYARVAIGRRLQLRRRLVADRFAYLRNDAPVADMPAAPARVPAATR